MPQNRDHRPRQPLRQFLPLLSAIVVFAWSHLAHATPSGTKHILLLNSYHPTYGWTANIVEGVRSVFDRLDDADLAIEFMDTKKIYNPEYADDLAKIYSKKFAKIHFDLILSSDDDALNFLLAYRDRLFPGVPAVFCGVNNYRDGRLGGHTGFTGVNEENNLDRSLELIALQRPSTKTIVVLADKTATGVVWQKTFAARQSDWNLRFNFRVITDVTTAELETELRQLPRDAVVFWGAFMRDKADAPLSFSQSLKLVVAASPVPVYGFMDITVNHGAVGGYVVSGFAQGQTAAKLGLRVLAGEPVDSIPIVRESPNIYLFDYKAMEHFQIDARRLPPGAVVQNRPFSFYEQYKQYVWAALSGMGIESAIILVLIGMIRAITRRSRAKLRESEERYRSIVEDGTEYIGRFDGSGTIVFANAALASLAGCSSDVAIGRSFQQLTGIQTEAMQERLRQLAVDAPTCTLENRIEAATGQVHWIDWVLRGFFDERGDLLEVQVVGHDTSERRLAMERVLRAKANLQGVLDGMREGLLVCDRSGRLTEIRSKPALDWFGPPSDDCLLWDYISSGDERQRRTLKVGYEQITDEFLPFDIAASQLPSLIRSGGQTFRLSCEPLLRNGELDGVIVVLADVTERLRQERLEHAHRELPAIVSNLLRDRDGFRSFVQETADLLAQLGSVAERSTALRILHTIKGNTAIYGFEHFASRCHELETAAKLDVNEPSEETIREMSALWREALDGVRVFLDSKDEHVIRVKPTEFKQLVDQLEANRDHASILRSTRRWVQPAMEEVLGIYAQTAERLGARFGKDVEATVLDNGLRLPRSELRWFLTTLVHVIRNAVDHGIEMPEERERAGKPKSGRTVISSAIVGPQFVVSVQDDGCGIDWGRIRERAEQKGLPTQTETDLIEALFSDGVSTKDEVTEISGRGVGLGAVREACSNLGGSVSVHSEPGKGTRFEFRFSLPSMVPPS